MKNSFKSELNELRQKYSMFALRDCTQQEIDDIKKFQEEHSDLPDGVVTDEILNDGNRETVYRRETEILDSTHEDRIEYVLLAQAEHLSAIRKMLSFFVVLTCIGIVAGLILALAALSA